MLLGNAAGDFSTYRADTGEKLWSMPVQSPVMAAPVTYEAGGEQYVAVLSGWGGAYPFMQGKDSDKSGNERNVSRVLVFKLGAKVALPPLPAAARWCSPRRPTRPTRQPSRWESSCSAVSAAFATAKPRWPVAWSRIFAVRH